MFLIQFSRAIDEKIDFLTDKWALLTVLYQPTRSLLLSKNHCQWLLPNRLQVLMPALSKLI